MKAYTDLEQSKKLAEILPFESADMCYQYQKDRWIGEPAYKEYPQFEIAMDKRDITCWSLAALMNVLDRGALFITPQGWACQSYINFKAITSDYCSNPIDACYEMIIKLHELKML